MTYKSLEDVAKAMKGCTACGLHAEATNVVPGEGDPNAEVMFVGEGPGFSEDKEGRPFVGATGKFLDELLESVGLERADVFITNMVHCRPPGNRDPLPEELETSWPYLAAQVELIQPRLIVTLGRHSKAKFLPDAGPISVIHGQTFVRPNPVIEGKHDQWYVCLYHPAAGLHKEELKDVIRHDFQAVGKALTVLRAQ